MSEKLTESITHKCTYDEKLDLEAIARSEGLTLSELIRSINKAHISAVKERINSLSRLMCLTTDTVDTPFQLTHEPRMINVTPKQAGTKKVQLVAQMDFLAIQNLSNE